ncbi:UDP-2,3-diacylglucosamine diphosphatase [Reinekea blandensis]|uniref:UDP-2,3-diacylglucosamine hydrolase n=1 Tax=Reinekea blandensis MED297 TaxID=314283 RepID=A4BHH0_9GAMM|nr:UDP-2,3-diacylglucosamine diphosphatase [Reinekea blandensis]EAR08368.1 UDP-2,3-diacylglucosamine hydrolase [Reinekea blandensis MED297]
MTKNYSNALFVSDLHLMEDRPECIRAFFQFLKWIPEEIEALFILGDFFEYWVGDDVDLPYSTEVADALAETSRRKSITIYFLPGNRDFAIGKAYCDRAHMILLEADEVPLIIAKHRVLLSHGDLYCTDDKKYLMFRRIIRHPWVLKMLRSLSKKRRIKIAETLRAASKNKYQRHPIPIDVTPEAIKQTLIKNKCDILVHGHTHLADIHLDLQNQENAQSPRRMVLGDWHHYGWYGKIDQNGPTLHRFTVDNPVF